MKTYAVFDTEIIGKRWPVFLCCVTILETGERYPFWQHSDDDRADMIRLFSRDDLTFVSFNGWDFDYPLVCAAMTGWTEQQLKQLANSIIEGELRYWMTMKQFNIPSYEFDHIDLMEVAPGDKVSLKRYMGRMGYKTMMDMPVAHDQDLPSEALPTVVKYCFNDCGGTTLPQSHKHSQAAKLAFEPFRRMTVNLENFLPVSSITRTLPLSAILAQVAKVRPVPDPSP